jgi:hypothetical protein
MLDQLFIAPYLLKEHLEGKSIKESYRLKVVSLRRCTEGHRQMGELHRVRCAMVANSRTVKREPVALTLLLIRWHSSTLAGEP